MIRKSWLNVGNKFLLILVVCTDCRINVKQTSEVLGAMQVNDTSEIEKFESFNNIQNSAPFGG